MQDNINTIISNALSVDKNSLKDIKTIINQIKQSIINNKDAIEKANMIDKKNNNGFVIDLNVINNIFNNVEKDNIFYGDVTLSQKDENKKLVYGKQIMDVGNVVVISDGNPYTIIELAVRNIMAGNTTIFSNKGYMYGTNQLLIQIIQSVLEQNNISKYLVQIYLSEDVKDILSQYASIDLVICVGDHELQQLVLSNSKNKVLVSGYEYYDLYIEDSTYLDFLTDILNSGLKFNVYLNRDLNKDYPDAIIVDDVDEAIAQINYNGNKYSAAIFTSSTENASMFIKEVKSKIVTVNTSPTIERLLDIKQTSFINEKTVIYPLTFKFDGYNTYI